MKKLIVVSLILMMPYLIISLYLNFWVISQLNADRLIWFLFFMNIPIGITLSVISKVIQE